MMNIRCATLVLAGLFGLCPQLLAQPVLPLSTEVQDVYDFRNVGLADAMRLFSLQTGMKIVPSAEAGKLKVTLFLTNVPPQVVIESIARGYHLSVDNDPITGVATLMTLKEAEEKQNRSGLGNRVPGKITPGAKNLVQAMPPLILRGRVLERDQPPVVMIEVGGKLLMLTQNSIITINGNLSLRVEEVSATQVQLMILPQNELLILH